MKLWQVLLLDNPWTYFDCVRLNTSSRDAIASGYCGEAALRFTCRHGQLQKQDEGKVDRVWCHRWAMRVRCMNMVIKTQIFQWCRVLETCSYLTRTINLFQSSMPVLMLLDIPRGALSWVGHKIRKHSLWTLLLSQHSAHSLSLSGDTLVALEDLVLDFEKQKGLNFTEFSPVLSF